MNTKLKHLEFIQNTINRMAHNSFLLKGWMVTIMVGLFAIGLKEIDATYIYVALFVLFLFWALDGYYLYQEKLFIALYNEVRELAEEEINFSMVTDVFKEDVDWFDCSMSPTMGLFYGGLFVVNLLVIICI